MIPLNIRRPSQRSGAKSALIRKLSGAAFMKKFGSFNEAGATRLPSDVAMANQQGALELPNDGRPKDPPVIPLQDEDELERVRRRRAARRSGGRSSTVLSDDDRLGG